MWEIREPIDHYDHFCMSLCIVVFCSWCCFWFCISLVDGSVGCVFMCHIVVGRIRFCFEFVYMLVFICFFCVLWVSIVGCGCLAPNEDIVRFRCWSGSHIPFCTYFCVFSIFMKFIDFV